MGTSRRKFLKHASLVPLMGAGLTFGFPQRLLANPIDPNKKLLVIFNRGGADGLHFLAPKSAIGELSDSWVNPADKKIYELLRKTAPDAPTRQYKEKQGPDYTYQPSLRLTANNAATLPSAPGMPEFVMNKEIFDHIQPIYDQGDIAILNGVGRAGTRSHFLAWEAWEWSMPHGGAGNKTGWLHNTVDEIIKRDGNLTDTFLGMTRNKSLDLAFDFPGGGVPNRSKNLIAFASKESFGFDASPSGSASDQERFNLIDSLYHGLAETNVSVSTKVSAALSSVEEITSLDMAGQDLSGYENNDGFNKVLQEAALVLTGTDARCMTVNGSVGQWDTHGEQAYEFKKSASRLGAGLKGLAQQLQSSNSFNNVCVLVISEFGRTLDENGGFGTDHGDGSVAFVMGGGVNGGPSANGGVGRPVLADGWGTQYPFATPDFQQIIDSIEGGSGTVTKTDYPDKAASGGDAGMVRRFGNSVNSRFFMRELYDFRSIYADVLINFFGFNSIEALNVTGWDASTEGVPGIFAPQV